MSRTFASAAVLSLAVASARAASIAYVTDLALFSALAPCAQSAVSYNILSQTYDQCPEAVTELQSCVCTKNNNFASISSKVSVSIAYSCGSTASDDQSSAQSVLSAYCNPSATIAFATPTAVSALITEVPEFEYLAPCAKSALRYAVGTLTYDRCPSEAPALASCACNKNQNSLVVSQIINSSAKYSCSGHTADISSAQAMFAAYCAMNSGTTNFPRPSNPPGDMTYYITDLPQYSSLAPCAASGLSYAIQWQTSDLCPSGPQALASCVCLKGGMTQEVLKVITSSVKYKCSSTALEDVSSAVAVYNYYCSAAAAQVTAAGVSNSVEQSYPASRASGGPQQTGGSGTNSGTGNNGGNNGGSGGNGTSGANSNGSGSTSSGPSTPVIVGAVVGCIGGLALLGAAIFFIVKAVRKNRPGSLRIPDNAPDGDNPPVPLVPYGKQELHSDSIAAPPPPPSPSPSTLKVGALPTRADTVSPVSANTGAFTPPPNHQAELSGQSTLYPPMPNRPELHSQPTGTPPPPSPNSPELYGQPNRPELQGMFAPPPPRPQQHPNATELYGQGAPSPNRPELQGQGAMYPTQPQNMSELQGQGTQFHNAAPNRPELAGQYAYQQGGYPSPMSQQQQSPQMGGYQQQGYHPHPQASWQSGPVPELHEMDGGHGVAR